MRRTQAGARVPVAWNPCNIRSSPRKRGPRSRIVSRRLWIPAISASTRVHSPSKTGVNALNDALCAGMSGRGGRVRITLLDRHRLRHLDTFAADPATVGDGLDPHRACRVEGCAVGRVDVAGELEAPRRSDLDQRASSLYSCGQGWTFSRKKSP